MDPCKKNVFNWIDGVGNDHGFEPEYDSMESTDAPAGSDEKLRVLAERAERGMPLWHPKDPCDQHHEGDFWRSD